MLINLANNEKNMRGTYLPTITPSIFMTKNEFNNQFFNIALHVSL